MGRMTKASYERKENILLARLERVQQDEDKLRKKWQRALNAYEKTDFTSSRWLLIANKWGNTLQEAEDKYIAILDKLAELRASAYLVR